MIKIKVPATSANLGPGFDSIGMALSMYNYLYVKPSDKKLEIISKNGNNDFCNQDNLIYKTIVDFYNITGKGCVPNLKLIQDDNIPFASGLGSSAACVVSGLLAANYLTKLNLSKDELCDMAAKIEGHPDNSTPALVGSITVGAMNNGHLSYIKLNVVPKLRIALMIPKFEVKTEFSRSVLPKNYDIKDVVFNVSRVALLVAAFTTGDYDKLKEATCDRLHEPYRMNIINNMKDILDMANKLGAKGSFLSGAGPSLVAFTDNDEFFVSMQKYLESLKDKWTIREVSIDINGAEIVEIKEEKEC